MRDPGLPGLKELFPKLDTDNHEITSEAVPRYNCVAWAAGSIHHWWTPTSGYYWPPGALYEWSVLGLNRAFELFGFHVCANAEYEAGWEKIAIYVDSIGEPQHVARQLSSGEWTSKLGELEDIRHKTLEVLEGDGPDDYGRAQHFLKRERSDWQEEADTIAGIKRD